MKSNPGTNHESASWKGPWDSGKLTCSLLTELRIFENDSILNGKEPRLSLFSYKETETQTVEVLS